MQIKDVMTNEVVAVRRDASFKELAARLRQYRVSAFPVIDENRRVIGVVSEADLLAREALADEHGIPAALPVFTFFGAGLAYIRFRTDSVIPGMFVHGTFNAIALIAAVTT